MLTLKLWVPKRHSNSSLMTPEESQLSPRLRAMSLEESWLSLRLMALSLGESRHSLGVTKDELECLQGICDRSFIPRSPQNDSSPPYRKLENGRKTILKILWNLPLKYLQCKCSTKQSCKKLSGLPIV